MVLNELFNARLGRVHSAKDGRTGHSMSSESDTALDALLLERVQKPGPGIFCEDVS